jgi:uroporphyrinogen-III decarboxylase
MIMMIMDPDLMHLIHQWITDVYILLINHFAKLADMPITSVHVGECSGTMISNEQYAEFITPYVSQLGKTFGNIRLHSCGSTDHILDAISRIENLAVIDTGSNTSVAKIREMKGPGFEINLEPPVQLMLKDSPKSEILGWLDQVLDENKGGPIKFAFHLESGYAIENCLAIYDELKERNLICKD